MLLCAWAIRRGSSLSDSVKALNRLHILRVWTPHAGLAPLVRHGGNQAIAANAHICCADDQVVGARIRYFALFVGSDTNVLFVPLAHELADGPFGNQGQVTHNNPGVLAREFHLAAEAQPKLRPLERTPKRLCQEMAKAAD